jgi:hypothetical protein
MDDRENGSGLWSRRRFLFQTGKFSALALLVPPLALAEPPALELFQIQSQTTS